MWYVIVTHCTCSGLRTTLLFSVMPCEAKQLSSRPSRLGGTSGCTPRPGPFVTNSDNSQSCFQADIRMHLCGKSGSSSQIEMRCQNLELPPRRMPVSFLRPSPKYTEKFCASWREDLLLVYGYARRTSPLCRCVGCAWTSPPLDPSARWSS